MAAATLPKVTEVAVNNPVPVMTTGVPLTPVVGVNELIVGTEALIMIERDLVAVFNALSTTAKVILIAPVVGAVGVPEITPVEEFRVSPLGKGLGLPGSTDHV